MLIWIDIEILYKNFQPTFISLQKAKEWEVISLSTNYIIRHITNWTLHFTKAIFALPWNGRVHTCNNSKYILFQQISLRWTYKLMWQEPRMILNASADWSTGEINVRGDMINNFWTPDIIIHDLVNFNKPEILNQVAALEIKKWKQLYFKVRSAFFYAFFFIKLYYLVHTYFCQRCQNLPIQI